MDRIVETRRRIEHGSAGHSRVHIRELASPYAQGDDRGKLAGKGLYVRHSYVPRLGNQLNVRREQLRVIERPAALGGD